MRPLLLASVLVAAGVTGTAAQARRSGQPSSLNHRDILVTSERVDRFARWVKAVDAHEPGTSDEALEDIASWPGDDLRALWADAKFLVALMRNLGLTRFSIEDPRGSVVNIYSPVLLQRMRAMACAAIGRLASRDCVAIHASDNLDRELHRMADNAGSDRERTGEDNYLLRRAALLHADIEIIARPEFTAAATVRSARPLPGPQQVRADTIDGVSINVREVGIHWEVARAMLAAIKPKGADHPQPGGDPMVRDWYRATVTWMQHVESHDTDHVNRGRELFPADPDLLFL
ncbi:MAG TPA: hypothetical protein VNG89_26265, partial [Vicinamibacterales bacterium]|nr:hypothetical protein [Vicinamibacterales bacterium]